MKQEQELTHSRSTTAGNVHDFNETADFLYGKECLISVYSGYPGTQKEKMLLHLLFFHCSVITIEKKDN